MSAKEFPKAIPLTRARRLLLAVFVLVGAALNASAHSIGESNATFYVRTTGIDVELYMGMASGSRLLADQGQIIPMNPDNFPDYSDRLQAFAPDLFTVIGGDGTTLTPDAMTVSMTETTDVFYTLHYPLPTPMPGVLTIHADYIDKMVDGHVGTIYVMNGVGDQFGWGSVSAGSQDLQVRLPAVANLIKTAAAAVVAAAPPIAAPRHGAGWLLWGLLGCAAFITTVIAVRTAARQSAKSNITH